MKRIILAIAALLFATYAHAQVQTKNYIASLTASLIPDNNTNAISPANVRSVLSVISASMCGLGTPGDCSGIGLLGANNVWAGTNTFNASLTYGGVTLANSVTGTGSMVLSASPTFTVSAAVAGDLWASTSGATPSTLFSTCGAPGSCDGVYLSNAQDLRAYTNIFDAAVIYSTTSRVGTIGENGLWINFNNNTGYLPPPFTNGLDKAGLQVSSWCNSGGGQCWGEAISATFASGWAGASGNFGVGLELDPSNNATAATSPLVGGFNTTLIDLWLAGPIGAFPITDYIQISPVSNNGSVYAAHFGMFITGAHTIQDYTIWDNANATLASYFDNGAHDYAVSLAGIYSIAAVNIAPAGGSSGIAIAIQSGSTLCFAGNADCMSFASGAVDIQPSLIVGGTITDTALASSGTQCVEASSTGLLEGVGSSCVIPAQISGLIPSAMAGTNTTAAMTIAVGVAADSTGALYIPLGSPASWAVSNGNAANGYQGGTTLPNSSTIHMFLCKGASGVTTFASLSLTPTCPTGFASFFRRIFSFLTTGAGAPIPFVANEVAGGGMLAYLTTQTLDVSAATATTVSRTLYALNVPAGVKVSWTGRTFVNTTASVCLVTSPDETDVAPSISTNPFFDVNEGTGTTYTSDRTVTNTSAQIGIRCTAAGILFLTTRGWTDARRS